ncbi:hypothetical protein BLNAU_18604 [Blattamonas nauphoetae]|uniref:Uncharacterized protein n=1 Tax=Blattamonas nauphoetae TaxID=2049346 RepID=A0ABQ9X3V0_9EUKA|nr:hypothetical protein BLNAU_18604 [Blattamonas nauphoetae]
MEMERENNTRLEETKREVDEWIGMNKEKSHSIETLHTNIDQLTTERDTLKANLTATNQSLDESNQRIDTLSFEVSSLPCPKRRTGAPSLQRLAHHDRQADRMYWSERVSCTTLLNREIQACQRHFTPTALLGRHRRQDRIPAKTKRGKKLSLAPLSPAKHVPSMTPRKQRSKRNMQPVTEHDVEKQQKEMERRVVEQARKFNKYISSQVGTVASLTAANENTDGQKSVLD